MSFVISVITTFALCAPSVPPVPFGIQQSASFPFSSVNISRVRCPPWITWLLCPVKP